MSPTIPPASLASDADPCSPRLDDVGSAGQAPQRLLARHGLPTRWAGREAFTIVETGFGPGLDFLATWAAWRADPSRSRRLHFIAIEKHPLQADDLARLQAAWPEQGALAALRDAQLLKTTYAWGLRRREVLGLDVVDLRTNAKTPQWGRFGLLHVRHGKSSKGSIPKRRSVLSLPEFDWAIDGLRVYVEQVREKFSPGNHPGLWPTERGTRVGDRYLDRRFAQLRDEAGLPSELTLHSLRHSYVTHLIELGYAEQFVQTQVGHAYASTTAIYTSVSDDWKNRVFHEALDRVLGKKGGVA